MEYSGLVVKGTDQKRMTPQNIQQIANNNYKETLLIGPSQKACCILIRTKSNSYNGIFVQIFNSNNCIDSGWPFHNLHQASCHYYMYGMYGTSQNALCADKLITYKYTVLIILYFFFKKMSIGIVEEVRFSICNFL